MSSSQKRLLIIAAILAAIQFIVVPLMGYQDQQHQELELLKQRLARSEQLLENREEIAELKKALVENQQQMLNAIPEASDKTIFRISLQGDIQAILRKHNVKMNEFNWLTDEQQVSQNVQLQRAKIIIEAPVSQLAQAHFSLTQELPSIRFVDVGLRGTRANGQGTDPRMQLELLLEIATRTATNQAGSAS